MLSAWWECLKECLEQHDAKSNARTVCSDYGHLLMEGDNKCDDHPHAWVLEINEMGETEQMQRAFEGLCRQFKQGTFSAYPAWVSMYCARTLHLWCSAIEGSNMRQKRAWVPSIPIVSQGIITLFWVKKEKVLGQESQETMSRLAPVKNCLCLQTGGQAKHEGFLTGKECQVCGRLQICDAMFMAFAKYKVNLPHMCWHLTDEQPTTGEVAVRSTVTIGTYRCSRVFSPSRARLTRCSPNNPEKVQSAAF